MRYEIQENDTLTQLAKRYHVPISLILAHNTHIGNPDLLYPGLWITIPNIADIPAAVVSVTTQSPSRILLRARTAIGKGIKYNLGSGGLFENHDLPTKDQRCDCSGFVCWALGISRKTAIPFYKKHGGWIYTDAMVADIESAAGIFEGINQPEPGCIAVYGAGRKTGHVGIVSRVVHGAMTSVIHCSAGNYARYKDAIRETPPTVFNRADTLWGRFSG